MTKTLTEQWREGKLPAGEYYVKDSTGVEIDGYYPENSWERGFINHSKCEVEEVLSPVPSYRQLYGPNDGNIPVGLFTVLKLIKRDIEHYQKIRPLTDLECGIKSQVVSLLKKWGVK